MACVRLEDHSGICVVPTDACMYHPEFEKHANGHPAGDQPLLTYLGQTTHKKTQIKSSKTSKNEASLVLAISIPRKAVHASRRCSIHAPQGSVGHVHRSTTTPTTCSWVRALGLLSSIAKATTDAPSRRLRRSHRATTASPRHVAGGPQRPAVPRRRRTSSTPEREPPLSDRPKIP